MMNIKRLAVAAGIMAALFLMAACDNIYGDLMDPIYRGPASPEGQARKKRVKKLTNRDLEEIYKFIIRIRKGVKSNVDNLWELRETDQYKFIEERSKFSYKRSSWETMLKIREEWLIKARGDLPDEHPIPALFISAYLLDREMQSYFQDLYAQRKFDQEISKKLDEQLEKTRELLDAHNVMIQEYGPSSSE